MYIENQEKVRGLYENVDIRSYVAPKFDVK